MHKLHIENSTTLNSSTLLYNYIDNISIVPWMPNLLVDNYNIPCQTGGTANLTIKAGMGNGNKDYWIWMSVTGNYPGTPVGSHTMPLNWDILLQLGLMYPNFPGTTGFIGKTSSFGTAFASFTLPPDPQLNYMDMPIYFAYMIMAPGPSFPIYFVSLPVHIKYVP